MKNFLKKILVSNKTLPNEQCLRAFTKNFAEAVNVEWVKKADYYETIFYNNKTECIALFQEDGVLIEYRQNLSPGHLPEVVKSQAQSRGEIMNAVLTNKGNMLEYEIIIRQPDFSRFCLTISEFGEIIAEKKL